MLKANESLLYHKDIGFPKSLQSQMQPSEKPLVYSRHAQSEAYADRYCIIDLPDQLALNAVLIEIEVKGTDVVKQVWRQHYDAKHDLVIVVIPQTNLVKTVWLNERRDTHRTLKTKLYSRKFF